MFRLMKKNIKECKNNKRNTFIIKIFMKSVIIIDYDNSSTIVYGVIF